MKAIVLHEFGGPDKLEFTDLELPQPAPSQVTVDIKGIGVNPVDWKIREGYLDGLIPHQFPIIPGWDMAGVVTDVGIGVTSLAPGDEVWAYCRRETIQYGSYAEKLNLPEQLVTRKPASIDFTEAGAVPLAALTAWQGLFEAGGLTAGETVLVQAAAGGVGHFAVQLARENGSKVIGTASNNNHDWVKALGADVMIDYHEQDVADAVKSECPGGVDLVLDCVGGDVTEQSAKAMADNGRLVTIVSLTEIPDLRNRGVDAKAVFVRPDRQQLNQLAQMIDEERLTVHIDETFPLEKAAKAQEKSQAGHVKGKLVILP